MTIAKLTLELVRQKAYKLVLLPIVFTFIISCVMWPLKGLLVASAIFCGGLIWGLPSLLMAHFLFRNVSPRAGRQILITLYVTEAIKLIMIAILFVIISLFFALPMGYVLLGIMAAMVAFWFAPFFTR